MTQALIWLGYLVCLVVGCLLLTPADRDRR
mgnify:CR=1 FL=1